LSFATGPVLRYPVAMDAPANSARASPPLPERVGRYEILCPIASGGMAAVYLARARGHGGFEQEVALKLTHAHLRESPEFAIDLVEEAKLSARIRHRNVVAITDVGDDPLGVFLVMEYVEGDTLSGLRRRATAAGGLPVKIGVRVLLDALAGLHAAHELRDEAGAPLGIVHRDFSPQNILVGLDGVARLADFGIAKAASRLGETRTGIIKGKITYMAPEQARGGAIDRRTDVWSAGVIAWELFAGSRLYASEDLGTLYRIASETPRRLRSLVPNVPPEVDEAVAHALTVDPAARSPTAQAFARELAAACRATCGVAEPDEVGEYMSQLFGAKLAERRAAVAEIRQLREKVGQIVKSADASGPTPSWVEPSQVIVPIARTPELESPTRAVDPPAPPSEPPTVATDGPEVIDTEDATVAAPDPPVRVAVEEPPREGEPATHTDAISVSTASGRAGLDAALTRYNARRLLARVQAMPLMTRFRELGLVGRLQVAGVAAVLAIGIVVAVRSSPSSPPIEAALGPTPRADPSASVAPGEPGVAAVPPRDPASTASDAAAQPTLTNVSVQANAPVAALRAWGRALPVERPTREMTLALPAEDVARGGKIEVRAADGRTVVATLGAGATQLRVDFPVRAAPPATPTTKPATPPRGVGLAADPYRASP